MPVENYGYAAKDESGYLSPWKYTVRDPHDDEMLVKVLYCGICHSDIHFATGDWFPPPYPVVTGHEFVAEVVRTGSQVTRFKLGDKVGVGCMIDSCKECGECKTDQEQFCPKLGRTYGSVHFGEPTYGGYGKYVVLNERMGIRIPQGMKIEDTAPLLCAGITTWTPMMDNNVKEGNRTIGVIGLGGLGHMAVQFAKRLNPSNEVYAITRSKAKEELAKKLGATALIPISELKDHASKFDLILHTASGNDHFSDIFNSLKTHGKLVLIGAAEMPKIPAPVLFRRNLKVEGSLIGGIKSTQEMIDFCHEHNIYPMVEHIKMDQVNEAWERVLKSDVYFRFVIDVADSYRD